MKKLFVFTLAFFIGASLFAATSFKVVKEKATGKIVYRQKPDFKKGYGIKNAVTLEGGKASDYQEVVITKKEWDDYQAKFQPFRDRETKIQAETERLLREQAIENLRKRGEIQ